MDPKEAKIYIAVLIAACVLGIMLVYFIITIIRQQRKNLALHKEKIQAEINTLEKERKRIASDLHDELGPVLSAVRLQINSLNTEDEEDTEIIAKSNSHIDTILHRLREISNDLMPLVLVRKGLVVAIREYVEKLNAEQDLQVAFSSDPIVVPSKDTEIHMYRIVQEIIHNTLKHAKASTLRMGLHVDGSKLILKAEDDGVGFDYESALRQSTGFGLFNLASRVEILKGEIYLDSKPGKHTQYSIEVPLA
jgi:two-component system, NarL family, sensor kinase